MSETNFSNRFFLFAWLGQFISHIGSSLTGIALGALVLERTQTVTNFSLFVLALQLPGTILLPLAGGIIDRWNRRTAMLVCFIGGTLSTILVLILLEAGLLTVWSIAACSAVTFTFVAFHGPAYFAALSQMLPPKKLIRASGLTQFSIGLALMAAPIVGGLLLQNIGVRGILIVDIATFVVAIYLTTLIRIPAVEQVRQQPSLRQMCRDTLAGWHFIQSKPGLMWVVILLTVRNFFLGITQTVTPPMLLGIEAGDFMAALLAFSVGGLGLIIGGAILAVWGRMRRVTRGILLSELMMSLGILLFGCTSHLAVIAFAIFLIYQSLPFSIACTQVLMQYQTPIPIQGRVASCLRMLLRVSMPLGTLASGPLVDRLLIPLFADHGALAGSAGLLFGVGQIGSIRLVLTLSGLLRAITVMSVWLRSSVRQLDNSALEHSTEPSVVGEPDLVPQE